MTRYNNPLPHAQVPPSQGRPASSGHHAPQHPHQQGYAEPELTGWPRPPAGQQRPPAAGSYPDLGYPSHDAAQHDPYAALRPEGYGTAPQPAASPDPYGLAGYTAPQGQPGAAPGYPGRPAPQGAPSQAYDAFGSAGQAGGYPPAGYGGAAPGQGHHFGSPGLAQPAGAAGDYAGYGHQQPGHSPAGHSQPGLSADQWGSHDPHALGAGSHDYGAQDPYADPQAHAQWAADGYGHPGDPALGHDPYQGAHPGQHGTFDQSYAEDDALYEEESSGRGSWKKAAALLVSTVIVGGGLVYGASGLMGPGDGGDAPPLVRGAAGPSKVKPSEPGGKQFDHTDSKIMGRLGEASSSSSDEGSGVRRVPVVSVGRDGSIQPPPSGGQRETQAIVSVPGLTVIDNFGGPPGPGGAPSPNGAPSRSGPPASSGALSPTRSAAPKVEMVTGAESSSSSSSGDSSSRKKAAAPTKAPPAPKADAPKKVAAASPSAPTGPRPTGAGYVAVLASVPVSASSRIDALTQFADMQQKYGNILSSKTPDIQEANLGAKGTYHRLLVGPPGSRDSANSVCNQLKAQGYEGCWITAY